MNNNWIDKLEQERQAKERVARESVANIHKQGERLRDSGLATRIREVCDEANRRGSLNMKCNIEPTDNLIPGIKRIEVVENPNLQGIKFFAIETSESGIILNFDIRLGDKAARNLVDEGWERFYKWRDEFSCSAKIDPSKFSDEDIQECFEYLLDRGGKPRVVDGEQELRKFRLKNNLCLECGAKLSFWDKFCGYHNCKRHRK